MSKNEIMTAITRNAHRIGFKVKKHSPEILLAAGVVGTVTSTVMACKATTKLSGILEDSKEQLNQIHEYVEENGHSEKYSEQDEKKDLTIVYTQSAIKVAKLYAPSVLVGMVSLGAIVEGHKILRTRNLALAAAYATVDKGFKEYRGRVIERFGKDLDKELKYNIKAKEIEKVVAGEDGIETKTTETVYTGEVSTKSDYAKFFDETCRGWRKDAEYNLMFLKDQERYANDLLQTRGHLYLNEVYDMLGIDRTRAGQVVGWVYNEKNPVGDNRVDFGLCDVYSNATRRFVNGLETVILLDFNVDGDILDLM